MICCDVMFVEFAVELWFDVNAVVEAERWVVALVSGGVVYCKASIQNSLKLLQLPVTRKT